MEKKYYLQAIIDNAVNGIIVIDSRGIITYMNNAGLEMFGFTTDENRTGTKHCSTLCRAFKWVYWI